MCKESCWLCIRHLSQKYFQNARCSLDESNIVNRRGGLINSLGSSTFDTIINFKRNWPKIHSVLIHVANHPNHICAMLQASRVSRIRNQIFSNLTLLSHIIAVIIYAILHVYLIHCHQYAISRTPTVTLI